jgi:hypothetical protein
LAIGALVAIGEPAAIWLTSDSASWKLAAP